MLVIITRLIIYCYRALSPVLGTQSCCRFSISCSEYAFQQCTTEPFWRAIKNIFWRLIRCNPI